MKNTYFAVTREVKDGLYAYVLKISESDNAVSKLSGLKYANICSTKKRAEEIVDDWNKSYVANGTHAYLKAM